ncbi:MAG: RNA polymerase sigma factor [Planctomycetota bacterium]|nr:RNA polymerase sigma factor [Planctomycetota bacterium]MDE2216041.1 RNA polymerase sigma factor [Planctomycetota bacterium]
MDQIQGETHDNEIIKRILDGNINEFELLLKRYQGFVFGIVTRHIPHEMAEEIAHDVFIKVYNSLPTFKSKTPFKHWLSKITVRTCYDYWREQYNSRETAMSSLTEKHDKWLETVITSRSDEFFEKEEFIKETRETLNWALGKLSAKERMVLSMVYLEGFSVRETATLLGWSVVNVKVRSYRARKKLRKHLVKLLEQREEIGRGGGNKI